MADYTLTYSESVIGWPSFYSFIPEWILGANNFLYTFRSGQLWRHNVNEDRATFYGTLFTTSVTTVLNASPIETKVFKSIELVGSPTVGWGTAISSNLQSGYTTDFTELLGGVSGNDKEGHVFSYIISPARPENVAVGNMRLVMGDGNAALGDQYLAQRSINAVARYNTTTDVENPAGTTFRVNFPIGTELGLIVVGDLSMSLFTDASDQAFFTGPVIYRGPNIDTGSPFLGHPCVEVTSLIWTPAVGAPGDRLFVYVKNQNYESYGMLGDYAHIALSITTPSAVELFSVNSDVMKSFP
tara:strand:+ start:38 stop:934 length:897 start_codon:yes stop_codon:yes gene_type:complete